MVIQSEPAAMANAAISCIIVIVLMFYRKNGARHRPLISWLAYFVVLIYATVPFCFLYGMYNQSSWLVVIANIIICAAVLKARGNLARLVDALRH